MTTVDSTPSLRLHVLQRPAWLPTHVWPFQSYGIETKDSVLAVTEVGAGPALLLVHVGTWSFVWRDLVARLAPDFRCIFFDAPGNGLTQDLRPTPVTMQGASAAVAAVIHALDLRDFTLLAHDLGGPAALAAVAGMPRRVRGIVAMNAFGWRPSGAALRSMLAIMGSRIVRELDVLTGFIPAITSTAFGVGRHLDEPSRDAFRQGIGPRGRRAFHDYLRDARHCDALYEKIDAALHGPLSQVPLLTIFGERNDPFGFQKRWKYLFPDARQVVVDKGNHFPMCDAPDFVARAIQHWHQGATEI